MPTLLPLFGMLQSRPDDAALAGLMAFGCVFWVILLLAAIAFPIFCFWRIFTKAGYSGAMAFIWLVPVVGPIVVISILAFGTWPAGQR
jgi:membrane protein YdbS with pleckstrin-like domain